MRSKNRGRKKAMSITPKAKRPKTEVEEDMIEGVWSDDPSRQLESAAKFRNLLSYGNRPPIDDVIQSGVVSLFVEFLENKDNSELQYEAACVLKEIACGTSERTNVLIKHNAVPIFVNLLARANDENDLCEKATMALSSVASVSIQCRDYVLQCGALRPLLAQLHVDNEISMLSITAQTLSSFCNVKPPPPFNQMEPALYALERVLHIDDEAFLSDACYAIYHISVCSDSEGDNIQSLIEAGLVPRLVQLLQYPSVLDPALLIIMHIVSGDNQQTQVVINNGALPFLANLLTDENYEKNTQRCAACWTISNITVGTVKQIQSVIDANLIPTLVNLAQNAEFDIKKEAVCAITNVLSGGSHGQIKYMVEQSCIKTLCDLLECSDEKIISVCLDGLKNILRVGEAEKNTGDVNYYRQLIDDAGGFQKIENLQFDDEYDRLYVPITFMRKKKRSNGRKARQWEEKDAQKSG